jgi:phosphatidyl-myo-inositol dimannoside synthase
MFTNISMHIVMAGIVADRRDKFGKTGGTSGRVLLLTPSRGLGGGIERYAETLESVFAAQQLDFQRVDLYGNGQVSRRSAYTQMLGIAGKYLRGGVEPARIVVLHRSLLPTASLLARQRSTCGVSVVCHGNDVWGRRSKLRVHVEDRLMRGPSVRVVAVSNFTAGALCAVSPAVILPPGLSSEWFSTLVRASVDAHAVRPTVKLLTAFRLSRWRDKGLPQLLDAVSALGRSDISITVCGSGRPPADLEQLVEVNRQITLHVDLAPEDLAREFASADIFVLATQPRAGRDAFCESFGLVLVEAQIAGTPVVAPAHGGSRDAFVVQRTGVAPSNSTAEALAEVLDDLLRDPNRLERMRSTAAEWSREMFSPEKYAKRAIHALL